MPSASKLRSSSDKTAAEKKKNKALGAYDPASGTFHTLDSDASKQHKLDDASSTSEFDSISNNGSCSGESEDQALNKEKPFIPGLEISPDKQEKIRLKNERKHQRQKERKANELRERCAGYLMSRKLERLSQQLVAMGFSSESATMALIINEGDIEKSITFLLEDGDTTKHADKPLKLDISEELRRIADIETRYAFPLLDIERAVVSCEGDIDAAVRSLREKRPTNNLQNGSVRETVASRPQAQTYGDHAPVKQQQAPNGVTNFRIDHPAMTFQERDIVADWRNSHPSPVHSPSPAHSHPSLSPVRSHPNPAHPHPNAYPSPAHPHYPVHPHPSSYPPAPMHHHPIMNPNMMNNRGMNFRRLEEPPNFRQEVLAPPPIHPHLYQPRLYNNHITSPVRTRVSNIPPGSIPPSNVPPNTSSIHTSGSPSDSWDLKSVPQSIDYQAIDWSMGTSRSPFGKPLTGLGLGLSRGSVRREVPELSDLVSQEWTNPFEGTDLFHHQPVPSL